jgi:ABC-type transporter MlaC component
MTRPRPLFALVGLAVLALLAVPPAQAQPTPEATAAVAPILDQLEAFRHQDYDTAYTFASAEIRRLFDRADFEQMVKRGYPEIADSTRADLVDVQVVPDGHTYVRLKVRGANGQRIDAVYEMIHEAGGWKINSVVARPDPGEET